MAEPQANPRRPSDDRDRAPMWWALALGVILITVVGAVWIIADRPDRSATPTPAPATSEPIATGPNTPTASSSGQCNTGTPSLQIPVVAPKASWQLVDGIALPFSHTFGPTNVDGPIASCYAHSPTGAVFAAAQISTRAGLNGKRQVLERQVLPGPNRDAELSKPALGLQPPFPQIAAMKVLAATETSTTVQLVVRFVQNGVEAMTVSTLEMKWADDWKWDMDPPGGMAAPARVQSLEGFVAWGGA